MFKLHFWGADLPLIWGCGTAFAISETSTQADIRIKNVVRTRCFCGFLAIDVYVLKPSKTRVHTYLIKHDTYGLQGQKCNVRTIFQTGSYPIFFCCVHGPYVSVFSTSETYVSLPVAACCSGSPHNLLWNPCPKSLSSAFYRPAHQHLQGITTWKHYLPFFFCVHNFFQLSCLEEKSLV